MTDNQAITRDSDGELRGYLSYLKKAKEPERWLVYLVPKNWIHRQEIKSALEKLNKTDRDIHTNIVYWESVLDMINGMGAEARDPLVEEFRRLLVKEFGPLIFSPEEFRMLVSKDFATAYRVLRKLEELIDGILVKAREHQKYQSHPSRGDEKRDEYGIYFRNTRAKHFLYFGFWEWKRGSPNLEKAFYHACQGRISPWNHAWDVSGIPQELLDSADPLEGVWNFLEPLLSAFFQASDDRKQ